MLEFENTETFPLGLKVLVVDADPRSLLTLQRLLLACHYQVTICHRARDALSLLREKEGFFDIVMSEIHLPGGMDGVQLLEIINGLQGNLPVVMMSQDGRQDMVMKIIMKGACGYLLKPVHLEEIRVIWQHVVKKRRNFCKSYMLSPLMHYRNPGNQQQQQNSLENHDEDRGLLQVEKEKNQISTDDQEKKVGNKKDEKDVIIASLKKPRMVWTGELHAQFVAVVDQVGLKNAVPKKILELMNVPGLTRENVASHLQKYRLHLRRNSASAQSKLKSNLDDIANDCSIDHSNSESCAISKHLESQFSVFSEVDSKRMNVAGVGNPLDQQMNSYHNNQALFSLEEPIHQRGQKSWCYDAATMLVSNQTMPHGDQEIMESDRDEFMMMQRLQRNSFRIEMANELSRDKTILNQSHHMNLAAAYVSLSAPSIGEVSETEDTQNASTFILNIGDAGYDLCSRYEPTYFSS